MRAIRDAALTRGVPDPLTGINVCVRLNTLPYFDVHIQHIPTGLFVPVVIQILDHGAVLRADDPAIGNRHNPGVTAHTAQSLPRRREIDCSPGRTRIPAAMGTTSIRPDRSGFEGQLHRRLGKAWWNEGRDVVIEWITEELLIGFEES